jgi:hypothetical protein
MATCRSRGLHWSLLVAVVCLGLAIALFVLVPQAPGTINTSHTTSYPTPGSVTLPPTAPPAARTPASH